MKFIQAILTFCVVLAICVAAFSALFGIGWAWGIGLLWVAEFGIWGPVVYIVGTVCIIPAFAITISILEE